MPAPLAAAAGTLVGRRLARSRLAPIAIALLTGLLTLLGLMLVGIFAAIFGLQPVTAGRQPSALARAEIPHAYLRLYTEAGARYGIDPWILAAIGWIETQHGRSTAPGVRSGVNAYGCCAGPMQFNIRNGSPSTWDSFGVDGNHDGRRSPYDPADAIPAAAKYLRATGAPGDYRTALFAYNHAEWYVAQVFTKAATYRGAPRAGGDLAIDPAKVRELLGNPRIVLTPVQRADLQAGGIDPPDRDARGDRPPPHRGHHRAAVRPSARHKPRGRPRDGHWRRRRRAMQRPAHRRVRTTCARARRRRGPAALD
jgi:hypothetical protein